MKKVLSLVASGLVAFAAVSANAEEMMENLGENAEDAAITTKVKAALLKKQLVEGEDYNSWGIHVDTDDHVVTLSGEVENEEDKEEAGEAAQKVKGVTSVNNNLTVESD